MSVEFELWFIDLFFFFSSSSLRSALSVVRVSYLCIARKWCVRRGVIAIRVLASVCRASLCSAAEPYSGTPSDRTLKHASARASSVRDRARRVL